MINLIHGDCLEEMKKLDANSVDSIVTDPPYGLSFMGKKWDYDVPSQEIWEECLRVLKPGGYLLAFAGTRTQHRMAVRIEDAGFEIRDMIAWVYGSGFPKSLNIGKAVDKLQGNEREVVGTSRAGSKERDGYKGDMAIMPFETETIDLDVTKGTSEWEGWGTALKPALEPITVARKPLSEKTVAENVLTHGTGGINIDQCRVGLQGSALSSIITRICQYDNLSSLVNNAELRSSLDEVTSEVRSLYSALVSAGMSTNENLIGKIADAISKQDIGCLGEMLAVSTNTSLNTDMSGKLTMERFQTDMKSITSTATSLITESKTSNVSACQLIEALLTEVRTQELTPAAQGRFPANLIHDGSEEVVELFPTSKGGAFPKAHGSSGFVSPEERETRIEMNDEGSAARFFYCAKASKKDRDEGLEGFEVKRTAAMAGNMVDGQRLAGNGTPIATPVRANHHPTVKPTDLMRYLCRLVTPPGGTVLDPFMGSGSTGKAAKLEGFGFIGIEREAEYVEIAKARINETL